MREELGVIEEMAEIDSRVDLDALKRSRQAAEQLAAVGIELGGYRITPKLDSMQSTHPGAYAQKLR